MRAEARREARLAVREARLSLHDARHTFARAGWDADARPSRDARGPPGSSRRDAGRAAGGTRRLSPLVNQEFGIKNLEFVDTVATT